MFKSNIRQKIKKIETRTKKEMGLKKYDIKPRFYIILISVVLITLVISIYNVSSKLKKQLVVGDNTDNVSLDYNKYSDELKEQYNKEGQKNKFIEEYDNIQNKIGSYIILNSTTDESSFNSLVNSINEYIINGNWEKLELTKPTYFSGKYIVNNNGILKFKFSSKQIEPNWITDEDINTKIEFN